MSRSNRVHALKGNTVICDRLKIQTRPDVSIQQTGATLMQSRGTKLTLYTGSYKTCTGAETYRQ